MAVVNTTTVSTEAVGYISLCQKLAKNVLWLLSHPRKT